MTRKTFYPQRNCLREEGPDNTAPVILGQDPGELSSDFVDSINVRV